jgi:hypothetical protein
LFLVLAHQMVACFWCWRTRWEGRVLAHPVQGMVSVDVDVIVDVDVSILVDVSVLLLLLLLLLNRKHRCFQALKKPLPLRHHQQESLD